MSEENTVSEETVNLDNLTEAEREMVSSVKRGPGRPRKIRPEDMINPEDDYKFKEFQSWQLTEIFNECIHCSNPDRVVEYLRKNITETMVVVLRLIYEKELRYNIDTSELPGVSMHGFTPVFKVARNFELLIRTNDNDDIDPSIRERVMHTMFRDVNPSDHPLLVKIFKKHHIPGITKEIAEQVCMRKF